MLVKGTGERGRENPLLQYPLLLKGGGESRVSFLGRKGRKGEEVRGKKERTEKRRRKGAFLFSRQRSTVEDGNEASMGAASASLHSCSRRRRDKVSMAALTSSSSITQTSVQGRLLIFRALV